MTEEAAEEAGGAAVAEVEAGAAEALIEADMAVALAADASWRSPLTRTPAENI